MISLNEVLAPLQRSGIRLYTNLANQTPGCIKLTIGEPEFDTPQPIKDAAVAALAGGETHYAPNQGTEALRQAIAAFETQRGNPCTAQQVIVTAGACEALYLALFGTLNPGDEVILPTPAFLLYDTIATIAGAKVVPLDLTASGFQITRQMLERAITPRTRAIVLNSPNNPTGVVFSQESLNAVKEAVRGKNIVVISDNVYAGLSAVPVPDLSLDAELRDQLLLCQSFSKPYAMTGWRVGYLVGPQAVMDRLLLLHAAMITAVPTFIQTAAITALKTDVSDMADSYACRRIYACDRLRQMGLTFPEPEGAFYVFPDINRFGMSSGEFCTRMIQEAGVAGVPGSCFGSEGYIRLSFCCSDENLKTGLDRMAAFVAKLEAAPALP